MMVEKREIEDLAICGGPRTFDEALSVGRPNIGDPNDLKERIEGILARRWLSNDGPAVREFEAEIAGLTGVKHCLAVCNATIGLEIAIRALGLHGDVIMPSMTFVATAHALRWQGIRPVFCDIDPATHNLAPAQVEAAITPATTGILGVHLWGRPCAVAALADIAERHHLKLLLDAAHAFACSDHGKMVGNFGNAEVFSFHATKFCNSLEGGAIVTNDDEVARLAGLMRNFGLAGPDRGECLGTNGKMNEISAAMGLTSLASLDRFVHVNLENYHRYRLDLSGVPGISLMAYDETLRNNYEYIVLEVDERQTFVTRDQLLAILAAENVLARRYFYPGCHRMEPYRSEDPEAGRRLPETEKILERVICLPTGTAITLTDVSRICLLIRFAVEHGAAIREKLEKPRRTTRPHTGMAD